MCDYRPASDRRNLRIFGEAAADQSRLKAGFSDDRSKLLRGGQRGGLTLAGVIAGAGLSIASMPCAVAQDSSVAAVKPPVVAPTLAEEPAPVPSSAATASGKSDTDNNANPNPDSDEGEPLPPEPAPLVMQGALPPDPSTLPDIAPVSESEFSLDIDESADIGVAWPDMSKDAPEIELSDPAATPADTDASGEADPPASSDATASPENADTDSDPTGAEGDAASEESAVSGADQAPALLDDGAERRYSVVLEGLEEVADNQFNSRFNTLSTLKAEDGKPANIAQINRRMELDADLIIRILRAEGYYGATVRRAVQPPQEGGNGRLRAVFTIRPGARYTLSTVTLPGLAVASRRSPVLADIFPVKVGDPIDADKITEGRVALTTALGENGFPFARVDQPEVTVDHDTQKGDLEIVVRSGGYRLFGDIEIEGETAKLFSARHLGRIARFDAGDVYQASDVEDLRRAIVATGLVSTVSVQPKDAGDGEHANIAVSALPAPMRTISGEIGYGTGEGYRLEGNWQHRNFFPPEGAINVQGLIGTKEQAAGLSYRRNNFRRRDNVLNGAFSFYHRDYDAYQAKTLLLSAGIERQSNLLYQKKWVWSFGAQLLGTRELNYYDGSSVRTNRNFLIGALPVSLTYDTSDDLLNPTRGFRIGARVSPEASWQDKPFSYVTTQLDGSIYVPMSDRIVMASRVRLGSILGGVDSNNIAPSRRFYAGGGASVRGYAYQSIGPRDPDNNPYGGKSLAEFSLEARVKFGVFGVVPFVDAGNISTGFLPKLQDMRYGAGLGLRYYSSFGPIRIDVGTPINPQPGDSRITVFVSLGQAF